MIKTIKKWFKTTKTVNNMNELLGVINFYIENYQLRKLRFKQRGLGYEDFSISYGVEDGTVYKKYSIQPVDVDGFEYVIRKSNSKATRHVLFNFSKPVECSFKVIGEKKTGTLEIDFDIDLMYSDGTSRYEKGEGYESKVKSG